MADPVAWPMPEHPEDLGELERVYRQTALSKATTILRLLLLLVLVLAIGYGAYRLIDASSQWPESSRTCYLPIALLLLAFCVLFVSTPALQRYAQVKEQRRDVVVMCSGGVACYHDGIWHQAKWNDIAEIKKLEDDTGKGLVKEGTDTMINRDMNHPEWVWALFYWTIGGIWRLFGGDYRNYRITTKAGEQIKLGGTLDNFDYLVATIYRRTDAPLARH